jgi:hypothetical protein
MSLGPQYRRYRCSPRWLFCLKFCRCCLRLRRASPSWPGSNGAITRRISRIGSAERQRAKESGVVGLESCDYEVKNKRRCRDRTPSAPLIAAHRVARFDDYCTSNLLINNRLRQRYSRSILAPAYLCHQTREGMRGPGVPPGKTAGTPAQDRSDSV